MAKTSPPKRTIPEHEIVRRVILTGQELDAEPGGRLGWLVRFVREDPTTWLPEHEALHGYRLFACAWWPLSPNVVSFGPDPNRLRSPLTPADVRRHHRELRAWFHALVTAPGGVPGVAVPTDGYTMRLVRATRPGVKPAIFGTSAGGPFRTMLFQRAAQWVAATDRLVACPECKEPVLALRRRLFCSAVCLQKHHDRIKIAKRKSEKGVRG